MRKRRILSAISALVALILLPIATNVATGTLPGSWQPYYWVSWPIIIACAFIATRIQFLEDSARDTGIARHATSRQLTDLADAVRRQWTAELSAAGVNVPHGLLTRWATTRKPLGASPHGRSQDNGKSRRPIRGTARQLASKFNEFPAKRLVILGQPGSGKTALAMTLTVNLIERDQKHDQPVPIMFSPSGWEPSHEHLHSWLTRRIVDDYLFMMPRPSAQAHITEALAEGRIIPVLDGIDEMSHGAQQTILNSINRMHGNLPLILTCRTSEFETLVHSGGSVLADAVIVELDDVRPHDAVDFISSTLPDVTRWQQVFQALLQADDSPLVKALSTPLMISLATAAYRSPLSRPAEMLDADRFSSADSLEKHLLRQFVNNVYDPYPRPQSPRSSGRARHYDTEVARRWLSTLARHLEAANISNLAWWDIAGIIPQRQLELTSRVLIGLGATIIFGFGFELGYGTAAVFSGVLFGLAMSTVSSFLFGLVSARPQQSSLELPIRVRHMLAWTVYPAMAGVLSGIAAALSNGGEGGLLSGAVTALVFLIFVQPAIWLMRRVGIWTLSWRRHIRASAAWSVEDNLRRLTTQLAYALVFTTVLSTAIAILAAFTSGMKSALSSFAAFFLTLGLSSVLMLGLGLVREDDVLQRVNIRIIGRTRAFLKFLGLGAWIGCLYGILLSAVFAIIMEGAIAVISLMLGESTLHGQINNLKIAAGVCLVVGVACGIAAGVAGWLTAPVDLTMAPSPESVLRRSRTSAVAWMVVCLFIVSAGIAGGQPFTDVPGSWMSYGIGLLSFVSILTLTSNAWGKLRIAVGILTFRGDLPWRIFIFLDDAYRRGILRKVGPFYQFKHRRLQESLADLGVGEAIREGDFGGRDTQVMGG